MAIKRWTRRASIRLVVTIPSHIAQLHDVNEGDFLSFTPSVLMSLASHCYYSLLYLKSKTKYTMITKTILKMIPRSKLPANIPIINNINSIVMPKTIIAMYSFTESSRFKSVPSGSSRRLLPCAYDGRKSIVFSFFRG